MAITYKPASFIHRKIRVGNWLGLTIDQLAQNISCTNGDILTLNDSNYTLTFQSFNTTTRQYNDTRKTYKSIIFPKNLKINDYLYFRGNTGNYKLSNEKIFKNVINPKNKKVEKIVIKDDTSSELTYDSTQYILTIPVHRFIEAMDVAKRIHTKTKSYSNSVENYLSNQESRKFSKEAKSETTAFNMGEMKFAVDRLNLPTKRKKADLLRYLDKGDISSLEMLADRMLRLEAFSSDFTRKINDYFIKERLQDIVEIGREIVSLGKTDLSTYKSQSVILKVGYAPSGSNAHWFPWLQKQLLINEIKTDTPEVFRSFDMDWDSWVKEVERFDITPQTTLVGHSMGGGFWIRYLSEHPEIFVDKVVLVAPWVNLHH